MSLRSFGGFAIAILAGSLFLASVSVAEDNSQPKKASLEDIVKEWSPEIRGSKATKTGSMILDGKVPRVASHFFDVSDASFEDVWNFYAAKCGISERFNQRVFLGNLWQGGNGKPSYLIQERELRPSERVSVFTYRTNGYTVSASIQPQAARNALLCVLTVVMD